MKFNPKFSSYRSRIAVLALVLWIEAFAALHGHHAGHVILAVAVTLAAAIPESPGKKVAPEKYRVT